MKLVMEGQPLLVQLGVWTCVCVFLFSFVGVLYSIYLALIKTEALVTKPDETGLSYWERAARKNSRASNVLVQGGFKYLRYLMFSSILGCVGSFGALLVIIGVFGERG